MARSTSARPWRRRRAERVRAHVFLCMLGYYLEWHMRQRIAKAGSSA